MSNKNFKCTQQELYAVCALGWESFSQNLEQFSTLKPKYTQAYLEAQKANLDAVMRMHNHYQRAAFQESLRIDLKQSAEKGHAMWRLLQSHIKEAFPGEHQKTRIKASGQAFYTEAIKFKWEACQNLFITGETFIREHSAELMTNENMDPKFPEAYSEQLRAFNTLYIRYLDSVKQGELKTRDKTEANNQLYRTLLSMFTDARILFKGNDAMLKQFNFTAMLNQVSGPGSSGIKGYLSNGNLLVAELPGLSLTLLETGKKAQVNEDDAFRFAQIAAGNYTVLVEADGYVSQSIPVTVNTGSFTLLNIVMEPEERV